MWCAPETAEMIEENYDYHQEKVELQRVGTPIINIDGHQAPDLVPLTSNNGKEIIEKELENTQNPLE